MEFMCQFDVREILGQGCFSQVQRCIDKRTRQAFAVKEMTHNTDEQRERIEQEIEVSRARSQCAIQSTLPKTDIIGTGTNCPS